MIDHNKPPHWATRLLRQFGHSSMLEELEGDLMELFNLWQKQYGIRRARRKYIATVFTLIRPFKRDLKYKYHDHHTSTNSNMIGSYLKMGWRTLAKNRVSSLINISGLTLGLATAILIVLVVSDEFKYDRFHTNLRDNYLLMKNQSTNDGISTGRSTAGPMAEALRNDFPEVKYSARVAGFGGQQVVVEGKVSHEAGLYVDPDLFRIMTFNTTAGDPVKALETGSSVVLTNETAKKLFGDDDPMGKSLVVDKVYLTVGAVIKDIPAASTIRFGMALPFPVFERENEWLKKWDDNRIQTWVQLQPGTDLTAFNKKMTELLQNRSNDKTVALFAYPMQDLHLWGNFSNGHPSGGNITIVWILIAFGTFMLAVACVNFVNITTAQSEHRAREVGVRKVLGASRKWIVIQFLNESFLVSLFSLAAAVMIVLLIVPSFNTITHSSIAFDPGNPFLWLMILAVGLITSLFAGMYPAFFLSGFLPVHVLKGRILRDKGAFRSVLVTVQFTISSFFLICTIVTYAQFEYVQDRPIGYEQENLINIPLDENLSAKFDFLKNEAMKLANVTAATGGSGNILYSNGSVTGMEWPGKRPGEELSVEIAEVGYDWTKTIGIQMAAGRDFSMAFPSDTSACLINESAVRKMGLDEPVGSIVGGSKVIGVFRDFVFNNPAGTIAPMAVYLRPGAMRHLYVRVRNNDQWRQTLNSIEKICKSISPGQPFSFSFTKDQYQNHFRELADVGLIVSIFSGMTIFISALGLFGLSGFVAERRSKEMTIRKVFGATVVRVLIGLSKDFLKPVVVALLIVVPVTIFVVQTALSVFAYRVPLHWWMFVSGAIVILALSSVVVLYHGWRTAHESPVVRLRNE